MRCLAEPAEVSLLSELQSSDSENNIVKLVTEKEQVAVIDGSGNKGVVHCLWEEDHNVDKRLLHELLVWVGGKTGILY